MDASVASIYTDFQGISALKAKARKDSAEALDEVARQFESLMIQMMLKNMRQAGLAEGAFDNDQSLFYRDMYDQQLAIHLTESRGLGLADVIKRQLSSAPDAVSRPSLSMEEYRQRAQSMMRSAGLSGTEVEEPEIKSAKDFIRRLWPLAEKAAAQLKQAPDTLLAQAALETGWGQHMIRKPNGGNSFNLFGIKADRGWSGDRASVSTLEFEQGIAVRRQAAFRAYASFEESFEDYVDFIKANPRYRSALAAEQDGRSFLRALQDSGYATDPDYARKIVAILETPEMVEILDQLKSL